MEDEITNHGDADVSPEEFDDLPNHVAAMAAQTGEEYHPEPAVEPAPVQTVSKEKLEDLVQGAYRFDDIHVTAYRIGARVAEGLGFKVVEEG